MQISLASKYLKGTCMSCALALSLLSEPEEWVEVADPSGLSLFCHTKRNIFIFHANIISSIHLRFTDVSKEASGTRIRKVDQLLCVLHRIGLTHPLASYYRQSLYLPHREKEECYKKWKGITAV